jgi:hypothetical protein
MRLIAPGMISAVMARIAHRSRQSWDRVPIRRLSTTMPTTGSLKRTM